MKIIARNEKAIETGITNDYDRFTLPTKNRQVDKKSLHYRKILESIKKHSFRVEYPIIVYEENNGLHVFDGQHRYTACKELKFPFSYTIITKPDFEISEISNTQKAWSLGDYIWSYANQGIPDYAILQDYIEMHNLKITTAALLLHNILLNNAGNIQEMIKSGKFKVKNQEMADTLIPLLNELAEFYPWAKERTFIAALARLCRVPDFNFKRFIKKCRNWRHLLYHAGDFNIALAMVEDAVNWRVGTAQKVNLKNAAKWSVAPGK